MMILMNAYPIGTKSNKEFFVTASGYYLAVSWSDRETMVFVANAPARLGRKVTVDDLVVDYDAERAREHGRCSAEAILATIKITVERVMALGACTLCLLCLQGDFGFAYKAIKCRSAKIVIRPYALYGAAVEVRWIEKGKRREVGTVMADSPSLVVLDGHVDLDIPSMWTDKHVTADGVETSRSRGTSFSSSWGDEFSAALAASGARVIRDFRGYNTYTGGKR